MDLPADYTVDDIMESSKNACHKIIAAGTEVPFTVGFVRSDYVEMIVPDTSSMSKAQCDARLRNYRAHQKCQAVVTWMEIWTNTQLSPAEAQKVPTLEGLPGTVDAILIVYESPTDKQAVQAIITTNETGQRTIAEWEPLEYHAQRFGNYFPQN
jgi:hypothetical protein